jgi:hypothetical protein
MAFYAAPSNGVYAPPAGGNEFAAIAGFSSTQFKATNETTGGASDADVAVAKNAVKNELTASLTNTFDDEIDTLETSLTNSFNSQLSTMTFAPNGNIGINRTNPQYKLDVNGNCRIQGTLDADSIVNASEIRGVIYYTTGNTFAFRSSSQVGNNAIIFWIQAAVAADNLATTYGGADIFRIKDNGEVRVNGTSVHNSDDRIKTNEQYITNATDTIMKLKPQIYNKYMDTDCSGYNRVESGLIAQEMYYDAPELRHLVRVPDSLIDASGNPLVADHIETSADPSVDPDYSSWTTEDKTDLASVDYVGTIAYLIRCIQEQEERIKELESRMNV